jgi:hypothetical protein
MPSLPGISSRSVINPEFSIDPKRVGRGTIYIAHPIKDFEQALRENKLGYNAQIPDHLWDMTKNGAVENMAGIMQDEGSLFVVHHTTGRDANYGQAKANKINDAFERGEDDLNVTAPVSIAIKPADITKSKVYKITPGGSAELRQEITSGNVNTFKRL